MNEQPTPEQLAAEVAEVMAEWAAERTRFAPRDTVPLAGGAR